MERKNNFRLLVIIKYAKKIVIVKSLLRYFLMNLFFIVITRINKS